ncbi:MAG: hypothetical protein AAFO07_24245 [Bacteroidota bacterium]
MIRNFRTEMEVRVPIRRNNIDDEVLQNQILGEYIQIARKYGNRVKRRYGLD